MSDTSQIKELKKEIIEARALIIKSNNLLSGLSTEVRTIAKRQTSYERHISWNSFVAYVIFTVLIFTGIWLAYEARHSSLKESLAVVKEKADKDAEKVKELEKRKKTEQKISSEDTDGIIKLIREKQRQEAISVFEKLDLSALTQLEIKLLRNYIDVFRSDLSMQKYLKGLEFFDDKKYSEAAKEFRQSLKYKHNAGHAKAANLHLANALRLQGKPRKAIAILQRLIEEHLDRNLSDDAYWFLALSHFEAHQKDEALSVLRALMRQYPDSQYFRMARIKASDIQIHLYAK